ncbi:hypothetical protein [Saccharopolyspora sp. NPDC002376]
MAERSLRDKVAVIGGGGKNLGGLLSMTFADEGAKVVVHYNSDSSAAEAEKTVNAVREAGSEASRCRAT